MICFPLAVAESLQARDVLCYSSFDPDADWFRESVVAASAEFLPGSNALVLCSDAAKVHARKDHTDKAILWPEFWQGEADAWPGPIEDLITYFENQKLSHVLQYVVSTVTPAFQTTIDVFDTVVLYNLLLSDSPNFQFSFFCPIARCSLRSSPEISVYIFPGKGHSHLHLGLQQEMDSTVSLRRHEDPLQ